MKQFKTQLKYSFSYHGYSLKTELILASLSRVRTVAVSAVGQVIQVNHSVVGEGHKDGVTGEEAAVQD